MSLLSEPVGLRGCWKSGSELRCTICAAVSRQKYTFQDEGSRLRWSLKMNDASFSDISLNSPSRMQKDRSLARSREGRMGLSVRLL